MQTRRLVRGRKLRLGLVSVALVLFAVVAARYAGASGEVGPDRAAELAAAAVRDGIDWGFFHLLVFLIPFLFNAHAIGEEVESRTFTYLSSRPTGRFAITVGKWAAGALFGVALVVGATLVLHVAAYATEPSALVEELGGTLKAAGALALLTLFYSSLCTFWGAVAPEAAGIISALYLAVIEFLFGLLPGYFRCISMNYLGQQLAGLEKGGLMAESAPDVPMMIGASVIAMMAILFLGFAAMVVQISEYRFNRA
tara:strand:- start:2156 stop:2917 length:762 start_codon:yes stop_codon:yes gene_type:complete